MTNYREKLWPAPWLFISTALVIPASLLVFLPINTTAGIVVAIVLYLVCVALLILGAPTIEVTDTEFRAGRASLPLSIAGTVEGFSGEEARAERGTRLDARTWLLIRAWISPLVKIQNLDERDSAPYWVVSTRHPDAVVAAVETAKQRIAGGSAAD
ncbi:hypothetical protein HD599_001584 [Conyzicola lurida]|uniref:DUF3093 domain-containing protein n=1 Tax=Conyzicola lurida TaxID=1172621 RepID=A0A841AND4_9MICO|nr:DUF3093 domain-containing protein [Conyzicola lurida]MBB5843261.1 hypothetical protein [Conyzicola lurida]